MRTRGRTTERITVIDPAERASAIEPACLVVIAGPLLGVKMELTSEPVAIGRSEHAQLTVPHPSVSRQHCRVTHQERIYWLEDLGSTNKTFVNSKAITRVALSDGDRIKIGDSVLKFFDTGSVEANYQKQLVDLAVTDELTELPNRRHFVAQINHEISDARRHNSSLALLIADLDHFKTVNDSFGHLAGDQILKTFAKLLRTSLQMDTDSPIGLAGRLGGEEFGVLLPEVTAAEAVACGEEIRKRTENQDFQTGTHAIKLTVSLGVTMLSDVMQTHSDLLRAADEHMYEAKNSGRNKVVI